MSWSPARLLPPRHSPPFLHCCRGLHTAIRTMPRGNEIQTTPSPQCSKAGLISRKTYFKARCARITGRRLRRWCWPACRRAMPIEAVKPTSVRRKHSLPFSPKINKWSEAIAAVANQDRHRAASNMKSPETSPNCRQPALQQMIVYFAVSAASRMPQGSAAVMRTGCEQHYPSSFRLRVHPCRY